MTPLRAAIAGTGFIGGVHARSARLAGAQLAGVAASSPESRPGRGRRARRGAGLRLGRGDGARPGHRRRPHLHAEPPSPPARRGCAGGGQARDLREAARARRRRRAAARRRRGRLGPAGGRAVRLPLLPDGARGARARRQRADRRRCACCTAPICRTGSCAPTTTTGASTSGWAAPRARSPTSARTGATWPSSSPAIASPALSARMLTAVPERLERGGPPGVRVGRRRRARRAPVTTEDAAVVQFETDAGAMGSVVVSQISAGRKNRLWIELDGAEEALAFDQEQPGGALVRASRGGDDPSPRSRDAVAGRGALRVPSRRPSAGLRGLLRRVRGRRLRRRSAAARRRRACRRSPTGCAPR